jgi:serine/threonine protein kinase
MNAGNDGHRPGPPPIPLSNLPDPPSGAGGDRLPSTLGEYQLLEEIGRGGMGTIYRAIHTKLGRSVAVKVLAAEHRTDKESRDRFQRELRALGALDHPNIIRVEYAGEERGVPYLGMELVRGVDAGRLVRTVGRLPVADACEIARQTALALQNAFEHKLLHRDIKPSNLMIGDDGRVRLIDWGLARFLTPGTFADVTRAHHVMGTTNYLAPERGMSPESTDPRSDLYSLGCTLFHLLCGRPPYAQGSGEDRVASLMAHASGKLPEIRRLRPDVPAALARIIHRLLAKDPTDRYDTARQVAEALARMADGHQLPRLVEAYLHPPDGTTDLQAAAVTGPSHAGNVPVPPGGVPAAGETIPMALRIAALYLAIAVVVLGGIWCWYNIELNRTPPAPPSSPRVGMDTPTLGPTPDTEPPTRNERLSVVSPPPVPVPNANPKTSVALDFGRTKMLYNMGEEIRVTVRADGPGSITIDNVALPGIDGTPASGATALFRASAPLAAGRDVELMAGHANGRGALVVVVNQEPFTADSSGELERQLQNLADRGPNAFLDKVEALISPTGSWHRVIKYATRTTEEEYDRSRPAAGGSQAVAREPRHVAFCVGASKYQENDISDLPFAERDAVKMADDLARCGGYEVIRTLTGPDVTRAQVEEWLFRRLPDATQPGDHVVIYWSGHGTKVPDTNHDEPPDDGFDECLVLYDSQYRHGVIDPESLLIDDRLNEALQGLRGRKVALILDVCFAGGANKGKGTGAGSEASEGFSVGGLVDRPRNVTKGPGDPNPSEVVLLAASSDRQVSFGHSNGDLSVMTYFLDRDLELHPSTKISVADAYEHLKRSVAEYFEIHQAQDIAQTPVLDDPQAVSSSIYLRTGRAVPSRSNRTTGQEGR